MTKQVTQMVPLDVEHIDQGMLLKRLQAMLAETQQQAIAYAKKYGERAKKSKAEIAVTVTFLCEDPNTLFFCIKTELKQSLPQPPARISTAMGAETQDERFQLFVQSTGSAEGDPGQGVFQDPSGEAIS